MMLDGIVDDPVHVAGHVVIPRGATARLEVVKVQRASNTKGRDRISFKVNDLRFRGRVYPVATNSFEVRGRSEGNRTARKVVGGAGVGAAVGGIIGRGAGAAIGAAAGGTTGAIAAGSGKSRLVVPAETRLQFRFTTSVAFKR